MLQFLALFGARTHCCAGRGSSWLAMTWCSCKALPSTLRSPFTPWPVELPMAALPSMMAHLSALRHAGVLRHTCLHTIACMADGICASLRLLAATSPDCAAGKSQMLWCQGWCIQKHIQPCTCSTWLYVLFYIQPCSDPCYCECKEFQVCMSIGLLSESCAHGVARRTAHWCCFLLPQHLA